MNPFRFLDFGLVDLIDILLITGLLSFLYRRLKGTLAIQALAGLLLVILVNVVVNLLGFSTLNFILDGMLDLGALALIILFQPDIRKLLTDLGKNPALERMMGKEAQENPIDEVIAAVKELSQSKTGALLVFPKSETLAELNDPGKRIDALLTKDLLVSIFQKESRFHDGAAVIRGTRIESVRVTLPISKRRIGEDQSGESRYGTRHRAGLGITETSKAMAVIVSEETGRIAVAVDGDLEGNHTIQTLRGKLTEFLLSQKKKVTKL